jgi:MFS family permease
VTDRSFTKDLRIVLQGRDFRRLFAVRLSSQAGDGAFQVGLASLVFFSPERAATTQAAAVAAVVTLLPYTLIGPFAGVLLDVWQRRQILLVANAVRTLMVIGVGLLVLSGAPDVVLYGGALACLSLNRFFLACLGASLPQVVPHDELVMANAVSPTCGTIAALLGAGLGYLPRALFGAGDATDAVILLCSAAGYAASAGLATRMPRDLLGPAEPAPLSWRSAWSAGRDVLHDMVDGARHVRQRRRAARALAVIGVHRIGYGAMTISVVLLCRNLFNDPADPGAALNLLAAAVTASGLGIGLAAVLTPPGAARLGRRGWIGACVIASGAVQFVLLAAVEPVMLLVGAFLLGLFAQGAKICVDAVLQETVADTYRGRVFAFYDVVFNAAFVTAAGIVLAVVPTDGYNPVLIGTIGVVDLAAGALFLRAGRRRDRAPLPA